MSSDKQGSQQKRKRNRRRRPRSAASSATTEDTTESGPSSAAAADSSSAAVRDSISDLSSSVRGRMSGHPSSSATASVADRADEKKRAAMEMARKKRVAKELSGEQQSVYEADTFSRRTDPLPGWRVGSSPIQANHSFYSDVNAQELLVLIHSFLVSDMTIDVLMHETGYRIRGRKFEGVTGVCDFQIEMFIIEDGEDDSTDSVGKTSEDVSISSDRRRDQNKTGDDSSSALRLPRRRIRRRGDTALPGQILVEFQRRSGDGLVFQTFVAELMSRLEEAGVVNFSEIDYSRYGTTVSDRDAPPSSIHDRSESSVELPTMDDDSAQRSRSDPSTSASVPFSIPAGMRFESYLSSNPLGLPSMESAMAASSLPSKVPSVMDFSKKAKKKKGRKQQSPSPPVSPVHDGLDGSSNPLSLSGLTLSSDLTLPKSETTPSKKRRKRKRRKKKTDSMAEFACPAGSSDSSDGDNAEDEDDDLISSASVTTPPTSACGSMIGSTLGLEEYSTQYMSDDSLMGVCSSVSSLDSAMNAAVSFDKESIETALKDVILSSQSSSSSSIGPSTVDARMAGAIYLVNLTDLIHRSNSGVTINGEWLWRLNECLFECEPKLILKLCETMMRSLDAHLITCVCRVLFNLLSLPKLLAEISSKKGPTVGKLSAPMRSAAKAMCRKIESRWGAPTEVCGSLGPSLKVRVMPSQHVVSQIRKCMDLLNEME